MADRLVSGLNAVIAQHGLDWHVAHVGARVEFVCSTTRPRNGSEARAAMRPALERAIHLYLTNRGILLAPFHNIPQYDAAQSGDAGGASRSLLLEIGNAVSDLKELS